MTIPGHLDWHLPLVLLTPALLAWLATPAAILAGGGRGARVTAWIVLLACLALAVVSLRPGGMAAALVDEAALGGWVRGGPVQAWASLLCGIAALVAFRPATGGHPAAWCLRTGLALALPLLSLPLLVLAESDLRRQTMPNRWTPLRVPLALALLLLPALGAPPAACGTGAAVVVAVLSAGPWRTIAIAVAIAQACPPYA